MYQPALKNVFKLFYQSSIEIEPFQEKDKNKKVDT